MFIHFEFNFFIEISQKQYTKLLDSYQNVALSANENSETAGKVAELMEYLSTNFHKIKIINGQIC